MPHDAEQLTVIISLLRDLRRAAADLLATSRFQRGGYDGPFLRARTKSVGIDPVRIQEARESPTAILIEVDGTGHPGDYLLISDDRGAMQSGYRFPITGTLSIATGNPIRLIADRHQQLWATSTATEIGADGDTRVPGTATITIREARL